MERKSVNFSNSSFEGNLVQGNTHGNIEANIKSNSENQSDSDNFNYDFRGANIGNIASKVSDNARQQTNQYNYTPEQQKTLAESAKEIQQLLKQLEVNNPTATEAQKITYVNDRITPSFQRRVVAALQAGGEAAIGQFCDNPYTKVVIAIAKGWMKPQ